MAWRVVEALAAALLQDAHEIDHVVRPRDRAGHGGRVAQIRLHRMDLADAAQRLEKERRARAGGSRPGPDSRARASACTT